MMTIPLCTVVMLPSHHGRSPFDRTKKSADTNLCQRFFIAYPTCLRATLISDKRVLTEACTPPAYANVATLIKAWPSRQRLRFCRNSFPTAS